MRVLTECGMLRDALRVVEEVGWRFGGEIDVVGMEAFVAFLVRGRVIFEMCYLEWGRRVVLYLKGFGRLFFDTHSLVVADHWSLILFLCMGTIVIRARLAVSGISLQTWFGSNRVMRLIALRL